MRLALTSKARVQVSSSRKLRDDGVFFAELALSSTYTCIPPPRWALSILLPSTKLNLAGFHLPLRVEALVNRFLSTGGVFSVLGPRRGKQVAFVDDCLALPDCHFPQQRDTKK